MSTWSGHDNDCIPNMKDFCLAETVCVSVCAASNFFVNVTVCKFPFSLNVVVLTIHSF